MENNFFSEGGANFEGHGFATAAGLEGRREIKNNNWSTFADIVENTRHNKLVNQ